MSIVAGATMLIVCPMAANRAQAGTQDPAPPAAASAAATAGQAFLGVGIRDVRNEFTAAFGDAHPLSGGVVEIDRIIPGTAAFRSDLQQGDLITAIDNIPLALKNTVEHFTRIVEEHAPVTTISLSGFRIETRLTQEEKPLPPHLGASSLANVLNQAGAWRGTRIEKKVRLQPFVYEVALTQRINGLLQRTLPPISGWMQADSSVPSFIQALGPEQRQEVATRIKTLEQDLRADAFLDAPGVVALETDLHRQASLIPSLGLKIAEQIRDASAEDLLRQVALFLDNDVVTKSTAWPMPATQGEAEAQLLELLQWKRQQENRFFSGNDQHETDTTRQLLTGLLRQYQPGEETPLLPDGTGKEARAADMVNELEQRINYRCMVETAMGLLQFFSPQRLQTFRVLLAGETTRLVVDNNRTLVLGSTGDDLNIGPADLIIDFGGNDTYLTQHSSQQQTMIVDYSGNDIYQSAAANQIAAGMMQAALLLDLAGNDVYSAHAGSLGVGLGGIGLLIDASGDDLYSSETTSMGIGLFGAGILLDQAGNDRYVSGFRSQGVGMAGGVGVLYDREGNDSYICEGLQQSSYGEEGLFDGTSQGMGIGLRGMARGGIGLLADRDGDDRYESGNFSQGSGYFFGTGMLFDYSGNDRYRVGRYGIGAAAHSASAIFIDMEGNDDYQTDVQAICGAAWDLSVSLFYDHAGDDRYSSPQHFSFGAADQNGLAFHIDLQGNDAYSALFYTEQNNRYHGGQSAGLFYNINGTDRYPEGFRDNSRRLDNEFIFIDQEAQ